MPGGHWMEAGLKSQPRGSTTYPSGPAHALSTAACSAGSFSAVRISRPAESMLVRMFQAWTSPLSSDA